MELSVIVPVYNEAGNIIPLIHSIYSSLAGLQYELILIDDGSTDATAAVIRQNKNEHTYLFTLAQNSGQSAALRAGIEHSEGQIIVTLDGDMQNDPSDIPSMIQMLKSQPYDMVQGYRRNRQDSLTKKIPSALANQLIRLLFGIPVHDIGCSLKVFKRSVISSFIYFNGFHRYMPLLAHIRGIAIGEVEVKHHHRHSGKSKYGLGRTMKVITHLWLFKTDKLNTLPLVSYRMTE